MPDHPSETATRTALVTLSHELGAEARGLAILGEGNTSARLDADTFLVKASGSSLGTLDEAGVVRCRFAPLLALLERGENPVGEQEIEDILLAARVDAHSRKPSVECLFHAFLLTLPGVNFVGHTHPARTNAILATARPEVARAFAEARRFPDEVVCCDPVSLLLPYADPGLGLARAVRDGVEEFTARHGRPPRVILLASHGVITLGPSAGAVLVAMRMTEKAAGIFIEAVQLGGGQLPVTLPAADVARLDARLDEAVRRRALSL